MARDSRLLKRNLLVLPGGLLATIAALGLLYFLTIRKTGAPCAKYTSVAYHGVCYNTTWLLAAALLVGLILVVVGLAVFRSKPKVLVDHLYHGTPAHFGLALLSALTALPLLAYCVVLYLERSRVTEYVMKIPGASGTPPPTVKLLAVLGIIVLIGLIALIPYVALLGAQGKLRRRFLEAAETYEEPEAAFPGEPGTDGAPGTDEVLGPDYGQAPAPDEFSDEAAWPASRDGPELETAHADAETTAAGWTPASAAAAVPIIMPPRVEPHKPAPVVRPAPIVPQASGCRAMRANGTECGEPVGPGGRYCLRHACQGRTASGTACRNPALEGGTRCRAHSAS